MQRTNEYGSNLTKDNMNSNHNLIGKFIEIIVFEHVPFILLLCAN